MHRQRVPSLDTNNPVGWFARFIAIASTLGCGLAFSADKIPDMATNAVYDKIEAACMRLIVASVAIDYLCYCPIVCDLLRSPCDELQTFLRGFGLGNEIC